MRSLSLFLLRHLLIACAVAAAAYSFLLARATYLFEQDTAASVPAAVRLVPYNSAYLARLAAWRPTERLALLHRAVQVNPFDFQSWIQLGLFSEFQQHDVRAAEQNYRKAAEVNHMFLPKWTLTNFYFRRENSPEFFHWAKETLAITPYSPDPVFVQMWLITQDPKKIAAAIPDRPRTLLPYAWYLSNNQQNALIPPIVRRLVGAVGNRDPRVWGRDDLLAAIEDRLVLAGDRDSALQVWATLVRAAWLPQNIPNASHPITNGDFKILSYRHGFDWTFANSEGVRVDQSAVEGNVRLRLSGDEPESCVLLQQYIPVEANKTYRLIWQVRSLGIDPPSGLAWRLHPAQGGSDADPSSGDLLSPNAQSWDFHAPAGAGLARLSLEYSRPLGSLRAQGTVTLNRVSASAN